MCDPTQASDPEYHESLMLLRKAIATLEAAELETRFSNPELTELVSGAEFDVYMHERARVVYKISRVHPFVPGVLRGGWVPGPMVLSDGNIAFEKGDYTSIFDLFGRIRFGNGHGGVVYTEISAVASDGRVVLKQPLIDPVRPSTPRERLSMLPARSFKVLDRTDGLTATAYGRDGTAWCIGDLHEKNALLVDGAGLFIVDYNARPLSDDELERIAAY